MKISPFLIFFSIVLVIYSLLNYYIYSKGIQFFQQHVKLYSFFFWLIVAAYPIGRILERVAPSMLSTILIWAGAFWLALMVYFFLFSLGSDLVKLILYFSGGIVIPENIKQFIFYGIISISGLLVFAGHLNARFPIVKKIEIRLPLQKEVKMAMVSDIHMGTLVGQNRLSHIVDKINAMKPDIVVFAGDVVDEDVGPVIRQNLGSALLKIKAPLGVYAITGNHEYIGGAGSAVKYLQEHGIKVLRDTSVLIDNNFYLIGREDKDSRRFSGLIRKPVSELVQGLKGGFAKILLDHQPFDLQNATASGINLSLSGHTHHGQLWPFNLITRAVFERSYGYLKKENTHYYISCGAGTWGPPVRTSSRPEIVELSLLPE